MDQVTALENAVAALRSYAKSGNEEAEEAMPVVVGMLDRLVRKRAREREKTREVKMLAEFLMRAAEMEAK
jgi:hypothetical protein